MLGFPALDGSEEGENDPKDSDSAGPTETTKPMGTQLLSWCGWGFFGQVETVILKKAGKRLLKRPSHNESEDIAV